MKHERCGEHLYTLYVKIGEANGQRQKALNGVKWCMQCGQAVAIKQDNITPEFKGKQP